MGTTGGLIAAVAGIDGNFGAAAIASDGAIGATTSLRNLAGDAAICARILDGAEICEAARSR